MSWLAIVADVFVYSLLLYSIVLLFSYIFIGLCSIGAVRQYLHKNSFIDYRILAVSPEAPSMSIIAPAYNEAATVVENARSLLSIHYNNLEVIIVNDGSKDDSLQQLIDNFDLKRIDFFYNEQISTKKVRGIYKSTNQVFRKLVVVDKENGGKADALNVGINISANDYIVCIDVDCILEQDALLKLAKPFLETTKERVIATGGVVRIANGCEIEGGRLMKVSLADGFLPRMQTLEYFRAFLLGRMAWSRINGLLLISGAFGAFDKEIVINCGGYNHKTVGEDMELVVRMRRYMEEQKVPYRVTFIPDPLCWTEAPASFNILGRQRNRWTRGTIETLLFHKKMFFNPNYGLVGMLSYPYWFFFEFLAPIIEFFGLVAFIFFALFSETDWLNFFYLLSFILSFGFLYSVFAILMEVMTYNQYKNPKDIFRLILTALLEPFIFHPFVVWSAIQGNVDFLQKKSAWGEMTRQGFAGKKLGTPTVTVAAAIVEAPVAAEKKLSLTEKWLAATQSFAGFSLSWLVIALLFALFEVSYVGFMQEYPEEVTKMLPAAFRNAALFWLKYNIILYIPYIIVYQLSKNAARVVFSGLVILFSVVQAILIEYFSASLLPLGADFYSYSHTDIKQTLGASGGINLISITNLVCTLTVTSSLILVLSSKIKLHSYLSAVLPFASIGLLVLGTSSFRSSPFDSDFANNITLNKSDFFLSETLGHFFPSAIDEENQEDYASVTGMKQVSFTYVNEGEYPFLHEDRTPDVLQPFFNQSETPPNIVIIMVEGLGRAFTNEGAYLGNFTPFIDSLSQQSLYWKNFLSQGGRTFAVLPSLLGSLPFGDGGFLKSDKIPEHLSLLNVLKTNGYNTSFYYGGDAKFDNMDAFLKANATDGIYDEKTFPEDYVKMPSSENGFSWGYGDGELFRRYFELNAETSKPRLDVLLTVSTHSPFKINSQQHYLAAFEKRMSELNFDEAKKKIYRNNDTKYASILYADDALRTFFNRYAKRADFQNTIFLITGDHRMPELPMSTKIDRYHVPLIVYSPLLKRTASFESVSSHYDVAPSLLAYLSKNYNIKKPNVASWLGDGLDTARAFRNVHSYPLIQTKASLVDYVMGSYHLNNQTLFALLPNMGEKTIVETTTLRRIKREFNKFRQRNSMFANGAKLIPDSIYQKYNGIRIPTTPQPRYQSASKVAMR
ncbi:sulfatase-like hydrolase/transferase [Paradesertivirga mongoliensis]|uniref:Sulfatase-like hydrolase/transferase n=1 Tax=Paradesertivirga mongoliensis TaxID=2100740 RepID=A0ABW4ZMX1_9SPHI|nr:sulfatase-like hydrolase/transferase [Pedobacter mongoliensis]